MPKLKKEDFDREFRFREARREFKLKDGSVHCTTCAKVSDGIRKRRSKFRGGDEKENFCNHPERLIRIKLGEYWSGLFPGSHNIASRSVCDAYTSKPLPEGVTIPVIPAKHGILLNSQTNDILHADPNCPYVIEELRIENAGVDAGCYRKAGSELRDLSDLVDLEVIGSEICEMPCCASKLPYQTSKVDDYRRKVGIKPDGTEPQIWVRRTKDHGKKVSMSPEEAEAVFDLYRFNSPKFRDIYDRIVAVSNHLSNNSNFLGSKPLSEAVNPVHTWGVHHPLKSFSSDPNNSEFWVYDERLFDDKNKPNVPVRSLDVIPEGFILCRDSDRVVRNAIGRYQHYCHMIPGSFMLYGLVRPLEDEPLNEKGVTDFIDIKSASYLGSGHLWGEFGKGFSELACFDRE